MAKQSRKIGQTAARALRHLDRMTSVARKSGRLAQAAASIARGKEYRWQVPAEAVGLKDERFLAKRRTAGDGSGRGFDGQEVGSSSNTASAGTRRHRATALVEAATRSHRQIPKLSQAMSALSRIEQSDEYVRPTSHLKINPTRRPLKNLDARVPSFAEKGIQANFRIARSIGGITPPANVSPREFVQPSGNTNLPSDASGRGGITINSSPTVVINGSGGGAVQQDVIGALRAHREELFDQLKRESARRERAQF